MVVQAAGKAQPTKEYAKNFELSVVARGLSDLVGGWWLMVLDWWLVVGVWLLVFGCWCLVVGGW